MSGRAHAAGVGERIHRLREAVFTLLGETAQVVVELGGLALAARLREQQAERGRPRRAASTHQYSMSVSRSSATALRRASRGRRRLRLASGSAGGAAAGVGARFLARRRSGVVASGVAGVRPQAAAGCSTGAASAPGCAARLLLRSGQLGLQIGKLGIAQLEHALGFGELAFELAHATLQLRRLRRNCRPEPGLAADSLGGTRRRRPRDRTPLERSPRSRRGDALRRWLRTARPRRFLRRSGMRSTEPARSRFMSPSKAPELPR